MQNYRVEPSDNITDSKTFKFKSGFIDKSDDNGTVNVKIVVLLQY